MAKPKKPARKGGPKNCAPKKAAAKKPTPPKKPILQQVTDDAAKARLRGTLVAPDSPAAREFAERIDCDFQPLGTVLQRQEAERAKNLERSAALHALNRPVPQGKGAFWTRYQSAKNGRFVSACTALADKARTFGRRVLRKKPQ